MFPSVLVARGLSAGVDGGGPISGGAGKLSDSQVGRGPFGMSSWVRSPVIEARPAQNFPGPESDRRDEKRPEHLKVP